MGRKHFKEEQYVCARPEGRKELGFSRNKDKAHLQEPGVDWDGNIPCDKVTRARSVKKNLKPWE